MYICVSEQGKEKSYLGSKKDVVSPVRVCLLKQIYEERLNLIRIFD